MKTIYSVVVVLKDAMTGSPVTPSLVIVKSLVGIFGEVVYSGTKAGAKRLIESRRNA